ncbi:MAG: glucose-6-phosphate isomerase, partial [Spirochaetales bacterium]
MAAEWNNLDTLESFKKLCSLKGQVSLKNVLNEKRITSYFVPCAEGLTYNYAAKQINEQILSVMQELADEAQVIEKFQELYEGSIINTGENRKVLHHLLRGQLGTDVLYDSPQGQKNAGTFYKAQQDAIASFANNVHEGNITNANGEKFTTVVQIGIGGSDLGPRAMYMALELWAKKTGNHKMNAKFISNVDPDDAAAVCSSVNLSKTLFILVSKSGTTQETLANELFVKQFLTDAHLDSSKHMIAVTSETSPLAQNSAYLASFYIDDYIGGRFSSTSAVGGAVLSLAFGPAIFSDFLDGAHESDTYACKKNITENAALLDALIGIYERNVQEYPTTAILPYSQALSRFPAHLQQADMESNGKHVNRNGEKISYATGPVIFGEPGTNGQHS